MFIENIIQFINIFLRTKFLRRWHQSQHQEVSPCTGDQCSWYVEPASFWPSWSSHSQLGPWDHQEQQRTCNASSCGQHSWSLELNKIDSPHNQNGFSFASSICSKHQHYQVSVRLPKLWQRVCHVPHQFFHTKQK